MSALVEELEARGSMPSRRRSGPGISASPASRRLATIPGIGPLIASAIAATVADAAVFRSGREFAAWLGLVPRQNSTGGKDRLGRISRQGNGQLRRLLVIGAQAALQCSKALRAHPWIRPAGAQAAAGRGGRLGQQDGADRLGGDGKQEDFRRLAAKPA